MLDAWPKRTTYYHKLYAKVQEKNIKMSVHNIQIKDHHLLDTYAFGENIQKITENTVWASRDIFVLAFFGRISAGPSKPHFGSKGTLIKIAAALYFLYLNKSMAHWCLAQFGKISILKYFLGNWWKLFF